ncbi:hypothetical protein AVEN_193877-1 [Araneus ventricosus]|uniref:Uncharacterized protein n=1 Tax=Araneus ventricosus TaxID=182803 RepID=A0A4Y2PHA0_ARAVE|nr:hypothetical protein AVEN_193877-1 [Araneus ventricosus]
MYFSIDETLRKIVVGQCLRCGKSFYCCCRSNVMREENGIREVSPVTGFTSFKYSLNGLTKKKEILLLLPLSGGLGPPFCSVGAVLASISTEESSYHTWGYAEEAKSHLQEVIKEIAIQVQETPSCLIKKG